MKRTSRWMPWMTSGLLAVSVAINVLQAIRLRATSEEGQAPNHVGETVAPFTVVDRSAKQVEVRFDTGRPTVLYYFAPTCGWCERNWDNVRELARASAGRYRVVAITKENSIDEFLRTHDLPFEVYGGAPEQTRRALSLTGTPVTVVVSPQGRVSHEWAGAFSHTSQQEIQSLFDVHLPGLSAARGVDASRR